MTTANNTLHNPQCPAEEVTDTPDTGREWPDVRCSSESIQLLHPGQQVVKAGGAR
jgi:hypothetical protein